jgi:hypothetical protein
MAPVTTKSYTGFITTHLTIFPFACGKSCNQSGTLIGDLKDANYCTGMKANHGGRERYGHDITTTCPLCVMVVRFNHRLEME